MTRIVMVHDLKEENGKTIKENNLERQHAIPLGALVEIGLDGDTDWEWNGCRLYVVKYSRDCDGSPLYVLGPKDADRDWMMHGGFSDDCLKVVSE